MIEYAQAFALFALLAFAFFMEKSMRSKIEELPSQTEAITDKITGMTEVLDDIADLLNEAMHAVGNSAIAQTPMRSMEGAPTSTGWSDACSRWCCSTRPRCCAVCLLTSDVY